MTTAPKDQTPRTLRAVLTIVTLAFLMRLALGLVMMAPGRSA